MAESSNWSKFKTRVEKESCLKYFDKNLGGEMKSANVNYFKISLENLQKSFPFRQICAKYLEENSIDILLQV